MVRHGLAMSKRQINIEAISNFNIGVMLSASIYNDMKGGCLECGKSDWKRKPIRELPEYDEPVCSHCGSRPSLYVIFATVINENNEKEKLRIRHTQEGDRIRDIHDAVFTLKTINREIRTHSFDVGKYRSKESRETYIFKNLLGSRSFTDDNGMEKGFVGYIQAQERRLKTGKLSPAGLKEKLSLIKNHLYRFSDLEIDTISKIRIKRFYDSYTDTLRQRDKAVQELKTILRWAYDEGKLLKVPEFPAIEEADHVSADNFIDLDKQALVISKIANPLYRSAIKTMAIYGLRPCDVRALKWENIDREHGLIRISSHASLGEDIKGRKSQRNVEHTLPIIDEFSEILDSLVQPIDPKEYVFKGSRGGMIGGNVLTRAWNEACKLTKVKNVKMYWGTKHSTLSALGKDSSDALLMKLTGHTNPKIIRRYAQSNTSDVRELLSKRKNSGKQGP